MSCYRPIEIHDNLTGEVRVVPCGSCLACMQRKKNDLYVRLVKHYEFVENLGGFSVFGTSTYDDLHLPVRFGRPCFDKKHMQKFWHDVQNTMRRKYGLDVKYYVVTELGELTFRPHYHWIAFLLKLNKDGQFVKIDSSRVFDYFDIFEKVCLKHWYHGISDIKIANYGGLSYVCKYVVKQKLEYELFKYPEIRYKRFWKHICEHWFNDNETGDRSRIDLMYSAYWSKWKQFKHRFGSFVMFSQGVGASFESSENLNDLLVVGSLIDVNGYKYSIPRYYRDRILRKQLKEQQCDLISELDCSALNRQQREYRALYDKQLQKQKLDSIPRYLVDSHEYSEEQLQNYKFSSDVDEMQKYVSRLKAERRQKEREKQEKEKINMKKSLVQRGGYRLLNQFKIKNYE